MKKLSLLFLIPVMILNIKLSNAQFITGAEAKKYVSNAETVVISDEQHLPFYIKFDEGGQIEISSLENWLNNSFKLSSGFGLQLIKSEKDQYGTTHYRYQQTLDEIPVLGGNYIAHLKNDRVVSLNGKIRKDINVTTGTLINENTALTYALGYIDATRYKWEMPEEEALLKKITNDNNATYYPQGVFMYVPENGKYNASQYRLAYRFDIYADKPLKRAYVFIDAVNGNILLSLDRIHVTDAIGTAYTKYSGTRTFTTDYTGSTYRLRETGRGNGIETYDMNTGTNYGSAVDFTDANNSWNNINPQQDEVATDAHWGTEMTWDYYSIIHNRNSIDNLGFKLRSYVHYDVNYVNAFWDGTRMTYGDGDGTYSPLTTLDIIGHEITHGVVEYTANLTYSYQSGAMNEGFSDIFGTCIEFYAKPPLAVGNWTIGEQIGAAFRSMSNPNAYSQPDTYLGTYWYTGTGDNGGVHTNSGVLNYWFYLLSQGGSGTNDIGNAYNVTGITRAKAEKIAYRTLVVYLTASSVYADGRTASILACQDLYGGCSAEAQAVTNAWYAVGIGAAYSASPTDADFTACPATTCNNAPFTVQFTNLSTNGNTFTWYFGDGGTSTLSNPSHIYNTNGSYNVKLVANGGTCGLDSITKNNFIQVGPSYTCTVSLPTTGTGATQTSCTGTLYDSGICSDYTNNTNGTITISPTGASSVTITFLSFNYESGYDYLYIYNGPTTASPQFTGSPFTGSTIPGPFTSSGGSVTIRQTSDPGVVAPGFIMNWTCSSPTSPPVANFSADNTTSCTGIINFTDLSTNGPTSWLWDFGDGQTSTLQNPAHTYTTNGTFTVTLTATNTYGSDQEIKINYITINMPTAPTTTGASRCGTGSVTLTASGTGTLLWYNAPTGGSLVNTGTSFTTPSLTTTTTYYVDDNIAGATYNCAKPDWSGGGSYASTGDHYLIFNCNVPVKLVSVKMYGNITAPGNRTIELRGSTGAVLQSASVNVLTGANTYSLNFDLPAATNLRLGCEGTNIFRNNAGVAYPYNTPGFISVTGSDAGATYYYYFYNWVIQEASCISARTPVTATINPNVAASVSIAASPSGAICPGTSVTFTATPTNGGTTPSYQWKLNGGNVGTNSTTYTNASLADGNTVSCVMTSNAICVTGSPATSNTITMTVNPNLPAGVSIAAVPSGAICSGTSVTFTATPTNGGTTPSYQWKLNGGNVGTNSTTYTNASLANGNTVSCVMTSNATCVTGSPATSNTITMTVGSSLPASVIIVANPSGVICTGTSVTFTATPTNGGSTPTYQWILNGTNISGATNSTYTSTTLANADAITCVVTSSLTCVTGSPATSNVIIMSVSSALPASVSIAANPSGSICSGTSVTFTATPTNGGTTPTYQWKNNGYDISGATNSTYTSTTLANGNVITCVMTSSVSCATGSPATSNPITMVVNSALPASVSIAANPTGMICSGTSVTFTATPTNGGTTPTYQWKNNGSDISGATNSTYTSITLADADVITCVMTSNANCVTGSPATSNAITMTVNLIVAASVSIAANPTGAICTGTSVTFTATATNGGTTPTYQWKNNGSNISGATNSTYTSSTLADADVIICVMTSNANCVTGSPATSNSITMSVSSSLPASVSIAASPATTTCPGTEITFTATPVNGGTSPSYQWQVNGSNVGTDSISYSSSTLNDGDVVSCIMTSSSSCATGSPATSNSLTITIASSLNAAVIISISPGTNICSGANATFTATAYNGGFPSYQWKLNGSNVGTDSSTYSNSALADNDVVYCVMTSSESCATNNPATSNSLTVHVTAPVPVSVSITANLSGSICSGTSVTFTATPTNGGTSPVYQWQVNSANVGSNSSTYTTSLLSDGDLINCLMISSISCVSGNPATSNTITITIIPAPTANAGNDQTICAGSSATLTASGGGAYIWSNGDTTQSITVTPVATTTYNIVVTNNGCTDSDNVVVSVITVPVADFTANDTTVGKNKNVVFFDHSTNADSWEWHFGDGTTSVEQNPIHSYSDDGFYTVILVVTNTEGCSDTLTMTEYIHVYGDAELFIPLCFTPNNDGENDVLFVRGSNIDNHIEFTIFDQWGIIIFKSTDVSKGWDGTYLGTGTAQPIGNYIYRVKATSPSGDPLTKEGIISLVR